MANCKAMKTKIERQNQILTTLKNNPGKSVTTKSLQDILGVNYSTLWEDLKALKKIDNNIVRTRGAVAYNGAIVTVLKPERYSDNMNNEGYNDPTASDAIKTTEFKVINKSVPKPNEVWNVQSQTVKGGELYFVLAVDPDEEYATCIKYVPSIEASDISIKIFSKPLKYFTNRSWGMPLSYVTTIKERLASYLGINLSVVVEKVEVPVEVEKIVEKEVEKAGVGEYTKVEVDALLDKQRADIYEECFKLLAKKSI